MSKYSFRGQQAGERILFFARHHFITLARNVTLVAILDAIILGITIAALLGAEMTLILALLILPIVVLQGYWIRKKFRNTYFIITDRRVLVSLQHSPFKVTLRSIKLNQIREVEFEVHGALGSMFKYGTLIIRSDLETEVTDYKKLIFKHLAYVMDLKFYLDKITTMLEEGKHQDELPPFVMKKKGQRY